MWSYLVRRILQGFLILLIITLLCFILTRLSSDPMAEYANRPNMTEADREAIRQRLGLDQPIVIQYFKWLGVAAQGDLGTSFFSHQPVTFNDLTAPAIDPHPDGHCRGFHYHFCFDPGLGCGSQTSTRFLDNLITSFSFIGYSMPIFFIALGSMQIFAVQFKAWGLPYLPTGADIWDPSDPLDLARHLVLPVFCLVTIQTAGYSRYLRSSILEVLGMDYVRTARAKGLSSRNVLFKHALRNAILPFVTIVGLDIPFLLGGALVTESVFAWPGMGRLFWEYAQRGDYPVVLGVLLLTSSAVVFFTIIVDMAYTLVDPRIRLS